MSSLARLWLLALALFGTTAFAAPDIPALSARVVDAGALLSAETEAQLESTLAAHEQATSNQVAVLTVPDLQGYDIAEFALLVARQWQLGQRDRNNGALLLIARDERKMRIEVGYGLEGDLSDARAKRIIERELRPAFKAGDFDLGVRRGVDAILGSIEGSYTPPAKSGSGLDTPLVPLGFVSLFGVAHFLQGRVAKKTLNGLVGGSFGGAVVGLMTQTWYFGVAAALVLGFLFSRAPTGGGRGGGGRIGPAGYNDHSGGFGGGGFSGGGGGFGGGGASGGW